jgi:ribosome-binding protein aMBF1 (putative translation factor)
MPTKLPRPVPSLTATIRAISGPLAASSLTRDRPARRTRHEPGEGPQMITGEQVKAARKLLGWSQARLSSKSGFGDSTIAKFERGKGP